MDQLLALIQGRPSTADLHTGGRLATEQLAALASLEPGSRVLDVGAGLGGPGRFLADAGHSVTAVEADPRYCELLRELGGVEVMEGPFLGLELTDGGFDAAWSQHICMCFPDKRALYAKMRRAVRLGGTLALHEVAGEEPIAYPVPWAESRETSFLSSAQQLLDALDHTGWRVRTWNDETAAAEAFLDGMLSQGELPMGPNLALGPTAREKLANLLAAIRADRVQVVMGTAEAVHN